MDHYQYLFESVSEEQKGILIALLSDIGFDGFEENEHQLKAYTSKDIKAAEIDNIIPLTHASYSKSVVPEVNWNEKWEADFTPVTVLYPDSECIFANIRAHFHPAAPAAKHEIVITPKMSFGTGHHATTYGMIECMSSMDFTNKEVIDFGTGTGVLAILAEKLGAAHIIAIDNDEWSINNAAENIKVNSCTNIELIKAESLASKIKADIILANINLNVIISNLGMLLNAGKNDAIILLSGMLFEDEPLISEALTKHSINVTRIYEKNNWIVVVAKIKN